MRGGKRKGAGRKVGSTKNDNRKKMSITLPMDLVEWLRKQDLSQAKTIEKVLRAWTSLDAEARYNEGYKDGMEDQRLNDLTVFNNGTSVAKKNGVSGE